MPNAVHLASTRDTNRILSTDYEGAQRTRTTSAVSVTKTDGVLAYSAIDSVVARSVSWAHTRKYFDRLEFLEPPSLPALRCLSDFFEPHGRAVPLLLDHQI
ncbi:hypothetical protein AB0I30_30415 [Nocardia tengchongensis]|uniref:hypothetical protein n=1 Tax=Nocardia tengchongensis TaxID=2055889 RepID=UPI0033D6525D